MKALEAENEELRDVLPKTYNRLENKTLFNLLKTVSQISMDAEGDTFGKIYEYFLEIIEPYHGRIFDPAFGSGGMFVQSARFVENHKKNPSAEISVYGREAE